MSDFENYMKDDEEKIVPEKYFSMATVMPKKKIKVTAYLEDKDGDKVLISEIAESLVDFVNEHMQNEEQTNINSQMFPLCGQFMMSVVPRFVGLQLSSVMFQAGGLRQALLTLSLSSTLLMQYIQQHNLKIVTETEELTDHEVEMYINKSREFDDRLKNALQNAFGDDSGEDQ